MSIINLDDEEKDEIAKKLAKTRGKRAVSIGKTVTLRKKHRRETVFTHMLEGRTNAWIANKLDINPQTVRADIRAIYKYYKEHPVDLEVIRRGCLEKIEAAHSAMWSNYYYISSTSPGSKQSIDQLRDIRDTPLDVIKVITPKGIVIEHVSPRALVAAQEGVSIPDRPEPYMDVDYRVEGEEEPEGEEENDTEAAFGTTVPD